MCLYLNVPYQEKNEIKKLGAKWNPKVKKWYIDTYFKEYLKFSKWLLNDSDEAIIAMENLYIIEGQQTCWKCKHSTRVIGLGLNEAVHIYLNEYDKPCIEDTLSNSLDELHLAWVDNEEDIPPKLLQYLKENYSVKTGYSKTLGETCFANHCDYCSAIQGNWFLFDEPDSPLSSDTDGNELIKRMRKLKIKSIPIDPSIQINWNISFGSNDYAYFKYGNFEDLILSSNPNDVNISYEELYNVDNSYNNMDAVYFTDKHKTIYQETQAPIFKIKKFNVPLFDLEFTKIKNQEDIIYIANDILTQLIQENSNITPHPLFGHNALLWLQASISYLWSEAPKNEKNMLMLIEILKSDEIREGYINYKNAVDMLFEELEHKNNNHFAVKYRKTYKQIAGENARYIIDTLRMYFDSYNVKI